jgi:hypothetical protein
MWPALLQHHLYVGFGGGATTEEQQCWIALVTLQTRAAISDGAEQPVRITPRHVLTAIAATGTDKAPGRNGLGYAHFKAIGPQIAIQLADMFTQHANADPPNTNPAWKEVTFRYIPKTSSRILEEMRAIAITDCLQKIYLKSLLAAIAETCPIEYPSWQFGFVPGRQCADMLFLLQMLTLRASEWGVPLYLCKLDISQAFDSIPYHRVWQAMLDAGLPRPHAAALVRELLGCKAFAKAATVVTQEAVPITRGGRQGSPETPMVWNLMLRQLFQPMLQKWAQRKWDVDLERWMQAAGRRTPQMLAASPEPTALAAWADDLIIVAHDLETLQRQVDDVSNTLQQEGMRVKACKAEVMAGKWAAEGTIRVADRIVHTKHDMKCLGAIIRGDGSGTSHCDHSVAQAVAMFRAKAAYFKSKHHSLRSRMVHWMQTVAQVAMWASEVFPLSSTSSQRFDSLQLRHLVHMMGIKRRSDEPPSALQERFRRARALMQNWRIPQVSQLIWKRHYTWAGHVARQRSGGWHVYRWRDESWWWAHMNATPTSQCERRASAGHRIRWDNVLANTLGPDWYTQAEDRDTWRANLTPWLGRISRTRRSGFLTGIGM